MQAEIATHTSHFDRMGGADKVLELVKRFYQLMDELPESYAIRKLHPENLQEMRRQKAKMESQKAKFKTLPWVCLLPFAFCLLVSPVCSLLAHEQPKGSGALSE